MKCNVCGSEKIRFYGKVERFNPSFEIYQCEECDSLTQKPSGINVNDFYGQKYYEGRQEYSYLDERKSIKYHNYVWNARLKKIKRYAPEGGSFLDVGCSFGGFVEAAKKYFPSYGLDISKFAVDSGNALYAKSKEKIQQPKLFYGSLTDLPNSDIFSENSFSAISLIEVAEHLADPAEHFLSAYRLLKKNGLLVIQTANFYGWQAANGGLDYHYFLPGHLTYFNSDSLKRLLQSIGFSSFREFIPVEFGVIPKLAKSRGSFNKITDYLKWLRIVKYHYLSKIKWRGRPLTSSYVLYAFK